MKSWKKFIVVFVVIFSFVLVFDLLTKHFSEGVSAEFLKNLISFESTHNTGAAWSSFAGQQVFLVLTSVLFLILFCFSIKWIKNRNLLYYFSFSFIIAGAIGNLIDRIIFGYVRDFLKLEFMNFPIFNIADCSLTIGVILFFVFLIFFESRKKGENKSEKDIQSK